MKIPTMPKLPEWMKFTACELRVVLGVTISLIFAFITGFGTAHVTQLCPGEKECTLARIDSSDAEKAQFCADLMPKEKESPIVFCEPIYIPKYVATYKECDCLPNFEAGRTAGWSEAVNAEKMKTNEKLEYCDVHYCQEKILRSTARPMKR